MTRATIALTGAPGWAEAVQAQIGADYAVIRYADRTGYVTWLVDAGIGLILVDADDPDWRFWTVTPKSSPATRRIPILVVADDAGQRADALIAGADLALSTDDLLGQLSTLLSDYARVPDPALLEQLDCECQEPLPPLAIQGVEKFNAGAYYQQHDLFEEQWMHTTGPVRDLYRAILQVGIAYYQIERGNARGARKMLLRSVQWLSILPDVCQGVDVKQLRADSARVRAELERLGENGLDQFDKSLLKPVKMVVGR